MERNFGTEISSNYAKSAELSTEQRSVILYALEVGCLSSKIATDFEVTRSTIYRTKEHFQQHIILKSCIRFS